MADCIGDKVSGQNKEAKCYIDGCQGCAECFTHCNPPCPNCPVDGPVRNPEISDFVVVYRKLASLSFKHKWTAEMDTALNKTAWVASGNPVDGFKLKFQKPDEKIDDLVFPIESLRLAMTSDLKEEVKPNEKLILP